MSSSCKDLPVLTDFDSSSIRQTCLIPKRSNGIGVTSGEVSKDNKYTNDIRKQTIFYRTPYKKKRRKKLVGGGKGYFFLFLRYFEPPNLSFFFFFFRSSVFTQIISFSIFLY